MIERYFLYSKNFGLTYPGKDLTHDLILNELTAKFEKMTKYITKTLYILEEN